MSSDVPPDPKVPEGGGYLWWSLGAADNQRIRDEGISPAGKEVREVVDSLAKLNTTYTREQIALALIKIYDPRKLRWRWR